MQLTQGQLDATDAFIKFIISKDIKEMVISGWSGTGKSTLVNHLIDEAGKYSKVLKLICKDGDLNVELTATTNQAASELCDKTGKDTTTIHSKLGIIPYFDRRTGEDKLRKIKGRYKPLHNTLIIIDEASTVDEVLLDMIRKSTPDSKILYVMDHYQTVPIKGNKVPAYEQCTYRAKLTEVCRQKPVTINGVEQAHPIELAGEAYRNVIDGKPFPKLKDLLVYPYIQHLSGPDFQQKMDETFKIARPHKYSKVLAWQNSKVIQYNNYIRKLRGFTEVYAIGEKLITNQPIKNNSGDVLLPGSREVEVITRTRAIRESIDCYLLRLRILGTNNFIDCIAAENHADIMNEIKEANRMKHWAYKYKLQNTFADLRPSYTSTIHKAQGTTCDNVFINLADVAECHNRTDVARMFYVGYTRAENTVYLYGKLPAKYGG